MRQLKGRMDGQSKADEKSLLNCRLKGSICKLKTLRPHGRADIGYGLAGHGRPCRMTLQTATRA